MAWVITATRSRRSKRHGRLLLHRLLHQEPDGSWTWRVRGAKVPASRTTDVCLLIEPTAAEQVRPSQVSAVPISQGTLLQLHIYQSRPTSSAAPGTVPAPAASGRARAPTRSTRRANASTAPQCKTAPEPPGMRPGRAGVAHYSAATAEQRVPVGGTPAGALGTDHPRQSCSV